MSEIDVEGMASPTAERSKIEQIVLEFFAKSLHIILESRIPALCGGEDESMGSSASSSSSGLKSRDRWFNLALGDCTSALENFEPWRRSFLDPMVVDIVLVQPKPVDVDMPQPAGAPIVQPGFKGGSPSKGVSCSGGEGTVLERWIVQFDRRRGNAVSTSGVSRGGSSFQAEAVASVEGSSNPMGSVEVQDTRSNTGSGLRIQGSNTSHEREMGECQAKGRNALPAHVTEVPAVYKRTVVMIRSLYSLCRLLPAYRLFRLANTSSHCCSFTLTYRVSSSAPSLSEHEVREMPMYNFTPVETAYGRMRLSVAYQHTTAVTALEIIPPVLPRIIADYVGSPTTDPLKRFPGEPHSLPSSGVSRRGVHMVSVPSSVQNSPPAPSLGRRHSWSGGVNQMQPTLLPPSSPSHRISSSPSPSYPMDKNPYHHYPPSPYSPYSWKHPSPDYSFSPLNSPSPSSADHFSGGQPMNLYRQVGLSQAISIEGRLSPPFSPSPSPSPPTPYSQEGSVSKGPARSGSAPVTIPKPSHSRGPKYLMGDHVRSSLPPPSPRTRKVETLHRCSSESPSSLGQVLSHSQRSKSFESPLHMMHVDHGQQVWRNQGSIGAALHRVSSKGVLVDEADDEELSCPFAVDDDEAEEQRSSKMDSFRLKVDTPESSNSSIPGISQQRPPDAALGALVRTLKSAPPLRQSFYTPAVTMETTLSFIGTQKREHMSASPPYSVGRDKTGEMQYPDSGMLSTHWTKTAMDALDELQSYKIMRDSMRSHSGEATGCSSEIGAVDDGDDR